MVPMAGSGRVAESVSGGGGFVANPRSPPTPLSGGRAPPSEGGGGVLLLFAIEKQLKGKVFPAFCRKTQKSFGRKRCLQPLFSLYFWGQKYQKPPQVVLRGRIRPAALPGARKIKPMRHPVTTAPRVAPSLSASNESAESLCRRWRHYLYDNALYFSNAPRRLFSTFSRS